MPLLAIAATAALFLPTCVLRQRLQPWLCLYRSTDTDNRASGGDAFGHGCVSIAAPSLGLEVYEVVTAMEIWFSPSHLFSHFISLNFMIFGIYCGCSLINWVSLHCSFLGTVIFPLCYTCSGWRNYFLMVRYRFLYKKQFWRVKGHTLPRGFAPMPTKLKEWFIYTKHQKRNLRWRCS